MARPRVEYEVAVVDKASAAFSKIQSRAGSAATALGKFGIAAGAATAAGLAKLTLDAARSGDEINKLSTQLGLSVTALSQYQYVAQQTGVAFNQFALGIQRSTRRIAEAAQGTGEARGAIDELGLSAKDLTRLTPDKQFEALADALRGVTNESDQLRLAFKLFDSEGVRLLRTIKGLDNEGLAQLKREAADLGVVLTDDLADSASDVVDALGRIKSAAGGVGNALLSVFSPEIEGAANATTAAFALLSNTFRQLADGKSAIDAFAEAYTRLLGLGGDDTGSVESDLSAQLEEIVVTAKRRTTDLEQIRRDSLQPITVDAEKRGADAPDASPLFGEARRVLSEIETPFEKYLGQLSVLKKLNEENLVTGEKYNRAILQAGVNYRDAAVAASEFTDQQKKSAEAVDTIAKAGADTVAELVRGFTEGTAKIGDLFAAMAERIIAQLFEIYVTQQIVTGVTAAFGGGAGVRQLGGPVTGGAPYLVGERGPELFVPQGSGSVVPNNALGAPNISFTINSLDPRTAASVIVENREVIKGIIRQSYERGGRFPPLR